MRTKMSEMPHSTRRVLNQIKVTGWLKAVVEWETTTISYDWKTEDKGRERLFAAIEAEGTSGVRELGKAYRKRLGNIGELDLIYRRLYADGELRGLASKIDQKHLWEVCRADLAREIGKNERNWTAMNLLAWVFLNDHDGLWARLLEMVRARNLARSRGSVFLVEFGEATPDYEKAKPTFEEAFLAFAAREQLLIHQVNLSRDRQGETAAYTIFTNPVPNTVEQFKGDGNEIGMKDDRNAEHNQIAVFPKENLVKVTGPLEHRQRQELAKLFIEIVLGARLCSSLRGTYALEEVNPDWDADFTLDRSDPRIQTCRAARLTIDVFDPEDGTEDTVTIRPKGNEDAFRRAAKLLTGKVENRKLREVVFEVTLANGEERTYPVKFTRGTMDVDCYSMEDRRALLDFFAHNNLGNRKK